MKMIMVSIFIFMIDMRYWCTHFSAIRKYYYVLSTFVLYESHTFVNKMFCLTKISNFKFGSIALWPLSWSLIIFFFIHKGRNQVNKIARHGIVVHRLWEENLGYETEVIVTDSFGFIAQSLRFCCPNFIPKEKIVIQNYSFLR